MKTWIILGTCALLGACAPKAPFISLVGPIPISAPASVQVGEGYSVVLGPLDAPNGTPIHLVTIASYGPQVYQAVTQSGMAQIRVPGKDTRQSGLVTLIATAGNARGDATIQLFPGKPVEPITPLVGARAIIADGAHWSMVVGVPFDAFGNPVAEGTRIRVRALHPGNRLEDNEISVNHLLAWKRIYSGTRSGNTTISLQAGEAHGPESNLSEMPGWPVPFAISASPVAGPADGRQLITLRTSILRDQFDNVVPDGTLVTFLVESSEGGRRVIPAYTVGGIAETPIQAADQPSILSIEASVFGVTSSSLQIGFTAGPAVGTFPLVARPDPTNRSILLSAGPLLGALGQYIPDGTLVLFHVQDPSGQSQWLTGVAKDGHATVELRLASLGPGDYMIDASAGSGRGSTTFKLP